MADLHSDHPLPDIERVASTLRRFRETQPWLDATLASVSPSLRDIVEAAQRRMGRLQTSFSSTRRDAQDPQLLPADLRAPGYTCVKAEITVLVREPGWRLRELERETRVSSATLQETAKRQVGEWLSVLHGG